MATAQRSSATALAWAFTALVVYASLYPFSGWRWPAGADLQAVLALPWPRAFVRFDVVSNLLGYMPLGFLLCVAQLRSGGTLLGALALAMLAPSMLSFAAEITQNFLPERYPSLGDWALNSAGAVLGALLGAALQAAGLLRRWQALRERWFVRDSAGALVLLALWPVALLFPAPVPLGLGHLADRLREWMALAVADVPWAQDTAAWLQVPSGPGEPLQPASEAMVQLLGLLAPCLLAFAATRRGWRRALLVLLVLAAALAATTLSTALNFGPEHAWAWVSAATPVAFGAAVLLALLLSLLDRRWCAALGLVALAALVALVSQAPADPYFAQSLQAWEQGRFVRFHGLALWVGWLWPYAAMAWLLTHLVGEAG